MGQEDESGLCNGSDALEVASAGGKRKYKKDFEIKLSRKNFDFYRFGDPILFISHLSDSSFLIMHKPWTEVVKTFEAQPVHRHIFGT